MKERIRKLLLILCMSGMMNLCGCALHRDQAGKEENWSFQASGGGNTAEGNEGVPADGRYFPDGISETGSSQKLSREEETGDSRRLREEMDSSEHGTEKERAFGYVYLCGAVNAPGVYEIRDGMRLFEVIALAGGLTEEADAEWVNQAKPVTDGEQIRIYTRKETAQMSEQGITPEYSAAGNAVSGTGAGNTEKTEGKVNINTADREQLMTLPGIGEAKADAILKYRETHGSFSSIEEICEISGIKEAVFSKIEDKISIQD